MSNPIPPNSGSDSDTLLLLESDTPPLGASLFGSAEDSDTMPLESDTALPLAASLFGSDDWLFDEVDNFASCDVPNKTTTAQETEIGSVVEAAVVSSTSSSDVVNGAEASEKLSSSGGDPTENNSNSNNSDDIDVKGNRGPVSEPADTNSNTTSENIDVKVSHGPVGPDMSSPPPKQIHDAETSKEDHDRKRKAAESPPPTSTDTPHRKRLKGMPKRPLSAYNFFFQRIRPSVLRSGSPSDKSKKISFEELAKIIGKRWGELGKQERKGFEELAKKESVRYRREREAFDRAKAKEANARSINTTPLREQYGLAPRKKPGTASSTLGHVPASFANTTMPTPFASQPPMSQPFVPAQFGLSPTLYPPFTTLPPQQQQLLLQTVMQQQLILQQNMQQQRANNSSVPKGSQQQQVQPGPFAPLPAPPSIHHGPFAPLPPPAGTLAGLQPGPYALQSAPAGTLVGFAVATDPLCRRQPFPIPPGTEVMISDPDGVPHKFTVQYAWHSMKRDDAVQYLERLATVGQGPPNNGAAAEDKHAPP
jgi:hypothetical protein